MSDWVPTQYQLDIEWSLDCLMEHLGTHRLDDRGIEYRLRSLSTADGSQKEVAVLTSWAVLENAKELESVAYWLRRKLCAALRDSPCQE